MHRAEITSAYYGNTQLSPYSAVKYGAVGYGLWTMTLLNANTALGDSEHTIAGGAAGAPALDALDALDTMAAMSQPRIR